MLSLGSIQNHHFVSVVKDRPVSDYFTVRAENRIGDQEIRWAWLAIYHDILRVDPVTGYISQSLAVRTENRASYRVVNWFYFLSVNHQRLHSIAGPDSISQSPAVRAEPDFSHKGIVGFLDAVHNQLQLVVSDGLVGQFTAVRTEERIHYIIIFCFFYSIHHHKCL